MTHEILELLSEYFGDPASEYGGRRSLIYKCSSRSKYIVFFFGNDEPIHAFTTDEHTLQYCEDAAENWTLGIGEYGARAIEN